MSSDATIDDDINAFIAADLAERRRAFKQDADEAMAETKDDSEPLRPDRLALDIRCDETLATTTLLSIACTRYTNLGGAYPNLDSFGYNFALCAGKHVSRLTLDSLCQQHIGCKKTILDRIVGKLASKNIRVTLDENAEALKEFVITRSGFRFFANDDLPHAIQSEGTIDLPFDELRAVLRHDGPLAGVFAK